MAQPTRALARSLRAVAVAALIQGGVADTSLGIALDVPPRAEWRFTVDANDVQGAARGRVEQAQSFVEQRNLVFAIYALEAARELAPESAGIEVALGELYNRTGRPAAAARAAQRALELRPGSAGAREVLGDAFMRQGQFARAARVFRAQVAAAPDAAAGYVRLGDAYVRQDQLELALASFEQALERESGRVDLLVKLSLVSSAAGRHQQAAERAESALALDPDDPWAQLAFADARRGLGDADAAEAGYRKAIALQPAALVPRDRLAELQIERGRDGAAIQVIEALLERFPRQPGAHAELAELYDRRGRAALAEHHRGAAARLEGRLKEAVRRQSRALELEPGLVPAWLERAEAELAGGDAAAASASAGRALALEPASAAAHALAGRAHLAQGDAAGAEAELRQAVAADASHVGARRLLGRLLQRSRRWQEAAVEYERARELEPRRAESHRRLGDCRLALSQLGKAQAAYLEALALAPRDPEALGGLAWVYIRAERRPGVAVHLARDAAALRPGNARALYALGRAQYAAGRYEPAVESLHAAARLRPDQPSLLYHLGEARYALGDLEEARLDIARALELDPEFAGASEARSLLERIESRTTQPGP
jgi:tetratricopeptide (TPR) repeat protein